MKNIVVRSILIISLIFLISCFPNFEPQKKEIKMIRTEEVTLNWNRYIGVMDQNFPDLVIMKYKTYEDTICKGFNLADINVYKDTIEIGFYGKEDCIYIEQDIRGYKILIDTTYIKYFFHT